jgi:hypothetical protein
VKRPLIGKFEHQVSGYLRLRFDNDTTTVGVTGTHPFWSEDRHTWVKAQDLNIGENLKTQYGTAILTQRQTLETKTTVYNLEVYQDHNYLVSEDRLLVHNSCPTTTSKRPGRRGNQATRDQIDDVSKELENRGYEITHGGNGLKEEFLEGPNGGVLGGSFVDITAVKDGQTLRINTVDTYKRSGKPTNREATNAARIRNQTGGHLLLIPKR